MTLSIRSEAKNGAEFHDFAVASPSALTEKVSLLETITETSFTAILDENGNNVTSQALNGQTTVPAGVTLCPRTKEGGYFSSITASSGQVNYVRA